MLPRGTTVPTRTSKSTWSTRGALCASMMVRLMVVRCCSENFTPAAARCTLALSSCAARGSCAVAFHCGAALLALGAVIRRLRFALARAVPRFGRRWLAASRALCAALCTALAFVLGLFAPWRPGAVPPEAASPHRCMPEPVPPCCMPVPGCWDIRRLRLACSALPGSPAIARLTPHCGWRHAAARRRSVRRLRGSKAGACRDSESRDAGQQRFLIVLHSDSLLSGVRPLARFRSLWRARAWACSQANAVRGRKVSA